MSVHPLGRHSWRDPWHRTSMQSDLVVQRLLVCVLVTHTRVSASAACLPSTMYVPPAAAQPQEAAAILQQADGILQRSHCLLYTSTALSRMGGSPDSVAEGVISAEDGLAACAKHMARAAFLIVQEQRRHRGGPEQAAAGADDNNNNQVQAQHGAADQPAAPPQLAAEGAAAAAAAAAPEAAAPAPAQAQEQPPQQQDGAGVGVMATLDDMELLLMMVLRYRAGLPVPDHLLEPLIMFCDAYFDEASFAPHGFPPLPEALPGGAGAAAPAAPAPAAGQAPVVATSSGMSGLSAAY